MQQWFIKTIDKYTAQIIIFCVFVLVVCAFFNFFTRKKGSYTDYDETIKKLIELPFNPNQFTDLKNSDIEDMQFSKGQNEFQSKGEKECKRSVEEITLKPFDKCRPDFLKNEVTGKNLELDCYNEELKIAIEYNGIQHYEYTPIFHKTRDIFYNTKYRDKMKETLCRKNGVKLIVVPYTVKLQDIKSYIQEKLHTL
jgi:hypothetical protein